MTNVEGLSEQYLESLKTPEQWSDALLEHGSCQLFAIFSDKNELTIPNPKLSTQQISPITGENGGYHTIMLSENAPTTPDSLHQIRGDLATNTEQQYYTENSLGSKKSNRPKDRYLLTFADSFPKKTFNLPSTLPPGYMAIQYQQPMDNSANPSYEKRSGTVLGELLVVPTILGKKLIQNTLKSPAHMEEVIKKMLPGLTTDRQRPKVKILELIEGSDFGAILRGTKLLGPTSNHKVLELPETIGEIDPLPKLIPQTEKVVNTMLAYSPNLSEHRSDTLGDGVDPRDLTVFIGDQRMQYADKTLETSIRYSHYADRADTHDSDMSVQYTTLTQPDGQLVPFGRLNLQLKDTKILTDGDIRIDFRRYGDQYVLDFNIYKSSIHQNIDKFRGNINSLVDGHGNLPPILQKLSEQLSDNPANEFLIQGLRLVIASMKP